MPFFVTRGKLLSAKKGMSPGAFLSRAHSTSFQLGDEIPRLRLGINSARETRQNLFCGSGLFDHVFNFLHMVCLVRDQIAHHLFERDISFDGSRRS